MLDKMPVLTRAQISIHHQETHHSSSQPTQNPNPNNHHDLKEKMRSLTAMYEQQKLSQHATSSPSPAPPRVIASHHPSIDLLRPHISKQENQEDQNPLSRNRDKPKTVHVFIPREGKENNNEGTYSCPVKKSARDNFHTDRNRKLSMGGLGPRTEKEEKQERGRIAVFVRVRPMSKKEKEAGSRSCVRIVNKKDVFLTEFASENDYLRLKRVRGRHFCFDEAFGDSASQQEVYNSTTSDLVQGVLQGRNGTVFCYGATGAGKTHTMLGTVSSPGVMVLAIKDLFARLRQLSTEFSVRLSYLEVYNEMVRDLISPGRPLVLREDKQGIVAAGLTQYKAFSTDEVMRLLQQGNQNRTTEPTRCNETSSRSHAILQIHAEYETNNLTRSAKLSLIDLAGSERALATDARTLRSLEGANINRSLLALSSCINALVEGKRHVPYRNSKLTQLLKDSLGGACNTVMIANVSPSGMVFGETQNTLHWADRAKEIKTKPTIPNEEFSRIPESESDQSKLILELQKENLELRQQLMKHQQKILTLQAQSLHSNNSPSLSPLLSPQSRKTKRNILLSGNCFSTPEINPKKKPQDENAVLVKELKRRVKELEAEMERQKKEHLNQLKQKDGFIRELINKKGLSCKISEESNNRVLTRGGLRKVVQEVGELKSPIKSNRFVSPIHHNEAGNKKRSFWDIANGNSPSVLAINGRKTRSHVTAVETTPSKDKAKAPSLLLQPGFSRPRFDPHKF